MTGSIREMSAGLRAHLRRSVSTLRAPDTSRALLRLFIFDFPAEQKGTRFEIGLSDICLPVRRFNIESQR